MVPSIERICFLTLCSYSLLGQQVTSATRFDAADVHVSPRSDWVKDRIHPMQGGFLTGERYDVHRATMLDLIRLAYNVAPDMIYGGPSWLDYDRFEIHAKTKHGTNQETLRGMLQNLLADRFELKVQRSERGAPGYQLLKGQGESKLRPADNTAGSGGCQVLAPAREFINIQCRGVTMSSFAESLRRMEAGPLGNLTVIDSTDIDGRWDLDFQIAARAAGASIGERADIGIIQALDKVGLRLYLGKTSQTVLVVESVKETPAANQADIESKLPPLPPPEFEVAAIRPCADSYSGSLRFEPGGRVAAICMPIGTLIHQAFNLELSEEIVGLPKAFSGRSSNITIAAKAPEDSSPNPQFNAQAREMLNAMLRALLVERYKLVAHFENRPVDTDTLVAVKPKLARADSAGRTGCARQNVVRQNGALRLRFECRNMTMAQFAEQIQGYDLEIHYPVLDNTGMEGAWDFSFEYEPEINLKGLTLRFGRRDPGDTADDPPGTLTFKIALEKQLGLKLETRKRAEPVLVIDHMEETPTEN
jgi:uncharacterized protein (TIGR03435 family)